jgi:hypothetical protein
VVPLIGLLEFGAEVARPNVAGLVSQAHFRLRREKVPNSAETTQRFVTQVYAELKAAR